MIQRLLDLRQSSTSAVVSESGYTALQEKMHVEDAIELWLLERIFEWRDDGRSESLLVMLSGNAGDGKSHLIERILAKLGDTSDTDVVRDATHAETPTVDQMEQLAAFFSPFADGAAAGHHRRLALIAMNTGMALSFLASARDGAYGSTFHKLERVLKAELGLARPAISAPAWGYEVVNLDRRNVLRFGEQAALFDGMLDKLDRTRQTGILWDETGPCESCAARAACFVRTNVDTLRLPQVRESLTELLWQASLAGDVHLSPRNLWDLLYHVTTGGSDFFEGTSTPCDRIAELAAAGPAGVPDIQRRLLHNLLFEAPTATPRGPILDALAQADPALKTGRHGHVAESEAFNDPSADAPDMADAAARVGESTDSGSDPCLERLSHILGEGRQWDEDDRRLYARSAVRRARVLQTPGTISAELHDQDLADFAALLTAYRTWAPGGDPPPELREFKRTLVDGIRRIFGVTVGASTYFRQDSFSPATQYPAYAPVDLSAAIEPVPDEEVARGSAWLAALNYRPPFVTLAVGYTSSGTLSSAWHIRGDLALFRLFRRVNDGYAASSVDLEAFFGLRYACERLGSLDPDGSELMIRDIEGGRVYRLEKHLDMGQEVVELTEVGS